MEHQNLLLNDIEYKIDPTEFGWWRRYVYANGELFEEFMSHKRLWGLPLFHYTRGRCPETGKRVMAKGIIAMGRLAIGFIAIGHAAFGLVAIGQLGLGLIFGLGQASSGLFCIGQLSIGFYFGLGQFATGYIAVGQFAIGKYVLAQMGFGRYVWDMHAVSPVAEKFFKNAVPWLRF